MSVEPFKTQMHRPNEHDNLHEEVRNVQILSMQLPEGWYHSGFDQSSVVSPGSIPEISMNLHMNGHRTLLETNESHRPI
jgi:hypothetical protein